MSAEQESVSTSDIPLTQRIVEKVAAVKSTSALELTPLYTVIDPDALEDIFSRSTHHGHVQFKYEDCTVQVHSDAHVAILETD